MRRTRTDLGPRFSEGSRQIWVRMAAMGIGPEDVTRSLGWARGMLSGFMYGDRVPRLSSALALRRVLGIDPETFTRRPARVFVPPAARPHPKQSEAVKRKSQRLDG